MEPTMSKIAVLVAGTLDRTGRAPEALEQDMERVMEVLEDGVSGAAIGSVVGCDLERSVIEMRFSVEADNSAAVHRSIGDITEIVDAALGGRVTTTMAPGELACA
jgi:hypothetical protein